MFTPPVQKPKAVAPRDAQSAAQSYDFTPASPERALVQPLNPAWNFSNIPILPPEKTRPATVAIEHGEKWEREAELAESSIFTHGSGTAATTPLPRRSTTQTPAAGMQPDQLTRGGTALPASVSSRLGEHFRGDLSHVRVHAESAAQQANTALDSEAFTFGSHIWLGGDQSPDHLPLIAHELAHVMQQAPNAAEDAGRWRIQTKRKGDPKLRIVEIIAFENSTADAQAKLSDGTIQTVENGLRVGENSLTVGDHTLVFNLATPNHYTDQDANGHSGILRWFPESVIEGPYAPSPSVLVHILKGSAQDVWKKLDAQNEIDAKINPGASHRLLSQFLFARGGQSGTFQDVAQVADAVEILHKAGVTEGELLILEQQRKSDEAMGFKPLSPKTPTQWAEEFVARREARLQGELSETLANRTALSADIKKVAGYTRALGKEGEARVIETFQIAAGSYMDDLKGAATAQLAETGVDPHEFYAHFEAEMRSTMRNLMQPARVQLIQLQNTFLTDTNDENLKLAIDAINKAQTARDTAADKAAKAETHDKVLDMFSDTSEPHAAEAANEKLKQAEAELQRQTNATALRPAVLRGLDLDASSSRKLARSKASVKEFVYHTQESIKHAEELLSDPDKTKSLYKADRIVTITKKLLGIQSGTLLYSLIDLHGEDVKAEEPLWVEVLNAIALLTALVDGPAALGLRATISGINLGRSLNEFGEQSDLHDSGAASLAPGKLGLILTAGGAVLDVSALGSELNKSRAGLGSLGPILEGDEAVAGAAAKDEADAAAADRKTAATDTADQPETDMRGRRTEDGEHHEIGGEPVAEPVVDLEPSYGPTISNAQRAEGAALARAALVADKDALETLRATLKQKRSDLEARLKAIKKDIRSIPKATKKVPRTAADEASLKAYLEDQGQVSAEIRKVKGDLANVNDRGRQLTNELAGHHGLGKLVIEDAPVEFVSASGVKAESWSKRFLLGKDRDQFRADVLAILQKDPDGPLSKALLNYANEFYPGSIPRGGHLADFLHHPESWQAAHALTRGSGEEVLTVGSLFKNQTQGRELERAAAGDVFGQRGTVATDKAYIIQGVAVDQGTAHSLVEHGLLEPEVLDSAELIDLME